MLVRCCRLRKCKLCGKRKADSRFTKKQTICDNCYNEHMAKSKEMFREFVKKNNVKRW